MPEFPSILVPHWLALALIPAAVFLYSLIVLSLRTILLVAKIERFRRHLAGVRTRDQLLATFAKARLQRLGSRIFDLAPPDWPNSGNRIIVQSPFNVEHARREITPLYRDQLARVHVFKAPVIVLVLAALGWMLDYTGVASFSIAPFFFGLVLIGALALAVLWGFGSLVVDLSARSLLDKISELPMERVEITLLRSMAALLERVGTGAVPSANVNDELSMEPMLERLKEVLESNLGSLRELVQQLSVAAEVLTSTVSELPKRTAEAEGNIAAAHELKACIDPLTTRLDRLIVELQHIPDRLVATSADSTRSQPARLNGEIQQQLRDLLKEFD